MSTVDGQVLYLGRWVPRNSFRAFVYNSTGTKLCESYDEFEQCISSGVWMAELPKELKPCHSISNDAVTHNVVSIKTKRGRKCRSQVKV